MGETTSIEGRQDKNMYIIRASRYILYKRASIINNTSLSIYILNKKFSVFIYISIELLQEVNQQILYQRLIMSYTIR